MPSRAAVRPIGHEDRLSIVEHLDELRTRLIVCVAVLIASFAICFWQNNALLEFIGKPLATQTKQRTEKGQGPLGGIYEASKTARAGLEASVTGLRVISRLPQVPAAARAQVNVQLLKAEAALKATPRGPPPNRPVTLGIGEPFTQTFTIAAYFGILFALPILLWQAYSFILPAFSPEERRAALPIMSMVPVLFIAGVAFSYVIVLPAATQFLQNFNADQFNVLVQARDYYKFAIVTLVSIGLVFQLPVGILALVRLGVVTVQQLRGYRRYAIVGTAVLAMVLPGTDPVSLIIEFVILYFLYESSVLIASIGQRRRDRALAEDEAMVDADDAEWDDEDDEDPGEDDDPDGDGTPGGPGAAHSVAGAHDDYPA